ncbi:MAG: hypothetical protein OEY33_02640 [Bdellovibrionales bacterium]|jgi:hypothetical protein|nr:hypothetical protein [Bdellovibrionales bacterium]
MATEQTLIQILNTAIIKSKEKRIDSSFDEKLSEVCNRPAIKAISLAISHLSETQNISRDQAAMEIVSTVRDLDHGWSDYLLIEGIHKVKESLKP